MPESDEESNQFYRRSMELLETAELPFLVGGAYAFCVYTGIARQTKDFDLFVRQRDFERALKVFRVAGYEAEKTYPHWLGKVFRQDESIDIIYRAGNGLCLVDDSWFERAQTTEVFGKKARLTAPEEMIWMKAFIMERERFDGADVAHLLLHHGAQLDWDHLLRRFGPDWRVLLSHLTLFGYIYPAEKARVPDSILEQLLGRMKAGERESDSICNGTLLSRAQYLTDVREGGWRDARVDPRVGMSAAEAEAWSELAEEQVKPHRAFRN